MMSCSDEGKHENMYGVGDPLIVLQIILDFTDPYRLYGNLSSHLKERSPNSDKSCLAVLFKNDIFHQLNTTRVVR